MNTDNNPFYDMFSSKISSNKSNNSIKSSKDLSDTIHRIKKRKDDYQKHTFKETAEFGELKPRDSLAATVDH